MPRKENTSKPDDPYNYKPLSYYRQQDLYFGKNNDNKRPSQNLGWRSLLPAALCLLLGYSHTRHLAGLFENATHFSHLGRTERELTFRTEAGLYYHYFKVLVVDSDFQPASKDLLSLIHSHIINDTSTEHPLSINSLQRFNLYPELFLAVLYRLLAALGLLHKECWIIDRSHINMPDTESCTGSLEPIYFYSHSVFLLHGLSMMFLFVLCWRFSNRSISAGLLGCLAYFFNHGECTRVMWMPSLRESMSFPFHFLQMISIVAFFQSRISYCAKHLTFMTLSTLVYMLPWQFAQFSLGTQAAAVFATYSLGFLPRSKLVGYISAQTASLAICFVLMFANRMLMTSFFASLLVAVWLIISAELSAEFLLLLSFGKQQQPPKNHHSSNAFEIVRTAIRRVLSLLLLMYLVKRHILSVLFAHRDDSHIWDILRSKFDSSFFTFDTRLYTCAAEFDFLDARTILNVSYTLLLPLAVLNVAFYSLIILRRVFITTRADRELDPGDDEVSKEACIMFNIFQLLAFSLMAGLIMRLKLFWTPHLCIFVSYFGNRFEPHNLIFRLIGCVQSRLLAYSKQTSKCWFIAILISLMAYAGIANISQQMSRVGEFNDPTEEALMNWISASTRKTDVFAGNMAVMANIKLSTNRPVTNHPHYEDEALRNRTMHLYSYMYGYHDVSELHSLLKNELRANYVLIENMFCLSHQPGRPECAMAVLAHISFERTRGRKACQVMLENGAKGYFKRAFSEKHLHVFKVL